MPGEKIKYRNKGRNARVVGIGDQVKGKRGGDSIPKGATGGGGGPSKEGKKA